MRKAASFLVAGLLLWAGPSSAQAVVLFVDRGNPEVQALSSNLEKRLDKGAVRRVEFEAAQLTNPITKGRLVASLQTAGMVITVGDRATEFAARELDDTPVYFVGTAVARGADLKSRELTGRFSYSADDIFDAVPVEWRGSIGLLYTPGYEPLVKQIKSRFESKGATLKEQKVERLSGLSGAAEGLFGTIKAIWVLGDPLLVNNAGFEYLVEASLARDVALIGAGPQSVRNGAVFCAQSTPDSMAEAAAGDLRGLIGRKGANPPEVALGPSGGDILYQPALSRKFSLSPQPKWKKIQ